MRDIFDKIISVTNIMNAWREFCADGKRRRIDVQMFERNLEDHVFELHEELMAGTYQHGPYHRFKVFDPKPRIIHKATVRDRLVHHAIYRVSLPIFERSFIFDSYSCRDDKGTHAAVKRLEVFARKTSDNWTDSCWALKFDIRRFFDSVDHGILVGLLDEKVQDTRMMALLGEIVGSFHVSVPHDSVGGGSSKRCPDGWFANRKFDQSTVRECLHGCIRPFYQRRFKRTVLYPVC